MQDSKSLGNSFRTCLFAAVSCLALGSGLPSRVGAETVVPLGPFRSVTLRNGGKVTLRYGSPQRVTIVEGSTDHTTARIDDEQRLVIDRCPDGCPEGYRLVVEIVTPEIGGIMVADGGVIQSRGSFPPQAKLGVAVDDGGLIDLRSMTVDAVSASVRDGGRILTTPRRTLVASVVQGGGITYWGSPTVKSSVKHGGVVAQGDADDADKPLWELGPTDHALRPLPPLPSVPPVPGVE